MACRCLDCFVEVVGFAEIVELSAFRCVVVGVVEPFGVVDVKVSDDECCSGVLCVGVKFRFEGV